MKKIFFILVILSFISSTGMAWPWSKKPDLKPSSTSTKVETKKESSTINNAREVLKELKAELQNVKQQNIRLKDNLDRANTKTVAAEAAIIKVQQDADKLKEWGIVQQAEKFTWMEKFEKLAKKYKRLKTIAVIIAAAAGIFLGLQFMALVPPPYNLAVPIGGAGIFALLVGIFL